MSKLPHVAEGTWMLYWNVFGRSLNVTVPSVPATESTAVTLVLRSVGCPTSRLPPLACVSKLNGVEPVAVEASGYVSVAVIDPGAPLGSGIVYPHSAWRPLNGYDRIGLWKRLSV